MTFINTNKLRISAWLARRDEGPARKLFQTSSYRSNDHGRGTEHNFSVWLWSLAIQMKFRPLGKR